MTVFGMVMKEGKGTRSDEEAGEQSRMQNARLCLDSVGGGSEHQLTLAASTSGVRCASLESPSPSVGMSVRNKGAGCQGRGLALAS